MPAVLLPLTLKVEQDTEMENNIVHIHHECLGIECHEGWAPLDLDNYRNGTSPCSVRHYKAKTKTKSAEYLKIFEV